jgi:hypothetical protein
MWHGPPLLEELGVLASPSDERRATKALFTVHHVAVATYLSLPFIMVQWYNYRKCRSGRGREPRLTGYLGGLNFFR